MKNSPFLTQLTGAVLVMGALVTGLFFLGRVRGTAPGGPGRGESIGSTERDDGFEPQLPRPTHAAYLIPEHAWLVVDFSSALVGALPFGDESGPCANVSAPPRALFAVLPGESRSSEPSFWLAAIGTSPAFLACAEKKMLEAGGARLPDARLPDQNVRVLSSRSGLLLADQVGTLLFTTDPKPPNELAALLGGRLRSVANAPPHELERSFRADPDSLLRASLSLPPDWLDAVGPDARRSPLAGLRGAHLTFLPSGAARGELRCEPRECAPLAAFVERAANDLLGELPPVLALRFRGALGVTPPTPSTPDRIGLTLSEQGVELVRAVAGTWLGPGPGAPDAPRPRGAPLNP